MLFEKFGSLVFRHRWIVIIFTLVLVGLLASQIRNIQFDTSTEGFLHENDDALLTYNEFRKQFGRDEFIVIAIESDNIFSHEFLQKLKSFHDDLENEVIHYDEITSLVNARNTRGEADRLIVEDLLEKWPENEQALTDLKKRVLSNPLYRNLLISEDAKFTTVVVKSNTYSSIGQKDNDLLEGFEDSATQEEDPLSSDALEGFSEKTEPAGDAPFLTDAENTALVLSVEKVVERYDGPDFKLKMAGSPVVTCMIKKSMMNDMQTFVKLVILTIGLCLFIMFRRISGVLFPLIIVALALVSTLGLMALFNVSVKLPTTVLPSFILAVGVGASVHILAIFYQNFQLTNDREKSICHALGHSGLAIVMTSLTTAAGLASFIGAAIAPISDLGVFASTGVLLALINTIVLLPAFLAVTPVKIKKNKPSDSTGFSLDRILESIASFSYRQAKPIAWGAALVILLSLIGASRLSFSHNPLKWLPEKMPVRIATEIIDRELKGTIALEVVVDTGRENGLYDLETLNKLEKLDVDVSKISNGRIFVGKTISLTQMIKEINKALNENRDDHYLIPQNQELIPQELLLFENSGSDDLEDVVDSRFKLGRFTIKAPWEDTIEYIPFIKNIKNKFYEYLGEDADITLTGMLPLLSRTIFAAIQSTKQSYIIAGLVITLMMILLISNIKAGLISMIPNLLPIILTLGLMGWLDMPLDMFTMMIGSIAIGLAVDDTVHFMHNFRRYFFETGDVRESIRLTLLTAGRAMLVTSIVLSIGFFIYMFASMNNLFYFGLLTGVTIICALLADFLVAPALMVIFTPSYKIKIQEDMS